MTSNGTRKAVTVATDGRSIGSRASVTRHRLLAETARLLDRRGVSNLTVVEVARAARTSPATFYQYFGDVDDAILSLVAAAGDAERELIEHISEEWAREGGFRYVIEFVDRYREMWAEHGTALRVRNLKAEEGDARYQVERRRSSVPMARALGELVQLGVGEGRLSSNLDPFATGAAIIGMIERLFGYQRSLARFGSVGDDLQRTLATIMYQTLVDPATQLLDD